MTFVVYTAINHIWAVTPILVNALKFAQEARAAGEHPRIDVEVS